MQDKIRQLVEEELARANEKFPGFASAHEGWAVIKEEVEEMEWELNLIKTQLDELWLSVKKNVKPGQNTWVKSMSIGVVDLIAEAIQVAAMARKFEQFLERSNADGEDKV